MNVIDTIRNVVGGGLQGIGNMIIPKVRPQEDIPQVIGEKAAEDEINKIIQQKKSEQPIHGEIPPAVAKQNAPEQSVKPTESNKNTDTDKKPTILEQISEAAKDSFGKNSPQNTPDAEKQALQMQLEQLQRQYDALRQVKNTPNQFPTHPQSPFQHEFSQIPQMSNAFLPMPQNQLLTGGQMPIGGYAGGAMPMMNPMMNQIPNFYSNMFASPSILSPMNYAGNNFFGGNNFCESKTPEPIDSIGTLNAIGTTNMFGAMNNIGIMGGLMGGFIPPIIPVMPFPMM